MLSEKKNPRLCKRVCKSTGKPLAYATFNGRYIAFGPAGPEAQQRFDVFLARWLANGRKLEDPPTDGPYLVEDLVLDFLDHARTHYASADGGRPTGEYVNLRGALAPVLELFGAMPAAEFGPLALRAVREQLVDGGRLCRKEINARVHRIRRAWRWAASMQKVPGAVVADLGTVDGLRIGKTAARESEPVQPVAEGEVRAVVDRLCPTIAAMVWFQWWTGARPGEACALRWNMIDRTGPVWIATLDRHKTAWRGRHREIAIGPKAQEQLRPLLQSLDPEAFVFSARRAVAEQRTEKHARRRSKVPPSQRRRAERALEHPREEIADHFTPHTLRRAIARGVRAANAAMIREQLLTAAAELPGDARAAAAAWIARLSNERCATESGELAVGAAALQAVAGDEAWAAAAIAACEKLPLLEPWGPNRLRHSAATRIRREEGLEAARVVLGHARAAVTEVYAEADHERSREIMRRLG
jgi:integrase